MPQCKLLCSYVAIVYRDENPRIGDILADRAPYFKVKCL